MQQTRWKVGSARMRAAQYKPTQAGLADFAQSAQKVKASKDEAVFAATKGGTKGNWEFVCEAPMAPPPPRRQDSETAFMPDAETMDTSPSLANLQDVVDVDMLPGLSDELLAQVAGDVLEAGTDLDVDALHTDDALHAFDEHLAATTGGGGGGAPPSFAAISSSPNSQPFSFAGAPPTGASPTYDQAQVAAAFEQAAAREYEAALDEASALLGEDALIDFDCLALATGGGGNTWATPLPPPHTSLATECARLATQCGGDFGGDMISSTQEDSGFCFSLQPPVSKL